MKLNISTKKLKLFLLLFCFFGLNSHGIFANESNENTVISERYLSEILDEIGEKYQVFFNYESSLISNIRLDFELSEAESLNDVVNRLMARTNLKYELASQKFIIIYKNDKTGKKKAKKAKRKIKKLQKLESQGAIEIRRNSTNPVDRSLNILEGLTHFEKEEKTINGTVKDTNGEPLIGATVFVKGTSTGTTTDNDGNFQLNVPDDATTLVVSYIGYTSMEVELAGRTTIDVEMSADVDVLDEVIVTALGISKEKKSLGYSVTQVDGEELSRVKSSNPLQALRGKVAGVNISNNAGGIKGSTRVVIRGNSTFDGSNQPLYIVDGISLQNQQLGSAGEWGGVDNGDGLSAINPDDIESVSVLKGGAAAALYGSRASNDDIAFMVHTDGPTDLNRNAWGTYAPRYPEARIGATLYDWLDSNGDPRLNILSDPNGPAAGNRYGLENDKLMELYGETTADYAVVNPAITTSASPWIFLSYAQTALLEAEFAASGGDHAKAEDKYNSAVRAHMQMWGSHYDASLTIDDAIVDAYLNANPYNSAEADKMIGEQYWATSFFDFFEGFSNFRRSGYPELLPFGGHDPHPNNLTNGEIPRRLIYPPTEASVNADNFAAVLSAQGPNTQTTRVWWDN